MFLFHHDSSTTGQEEGAPQETENEGVLQEQQQETTPAEETQQLDGKVQYQSENGARFEISFSRKEKDVNEITISG